MQGLQYNERPKQLGLMRLERRRRVRSDLIEAFKIIHERRVYDLNRHLFFHLELKVVEEDMTRNTSRDMILESMLFVTELLTTGTHYPQDTLIVIL